MKKRILMLLCCLLALALAGGSALASGLADIHVPTLGEILVSHRVFEYDGDGYQQYLVLFYYEQSRVIRQINDENHFDKSTGTTLQDLRAFDLSTVYTGYNDMDFADCLTSDEGDYLRMIVRFSNLDVLANLDKMRNYGLIVPDANGAVHDADSIAQSLIDAGMRELSMLEYGQKGLDFTVVDK